MTPIEEKLLREGTLEEFMDDVQIMDKEFLLLATLLGKEHHVRYILDKRRWPTAFPPGTIQEAMKVAKKHNHSRIVDVLRNSNFQESSFKFSISCSSETFYVVLFSFLVYYNRLSLGRIWGKI
jgi:hypothetical protein